MLFAGALACASLTGIGAVSSATPPPLYPVNYGLGAGLPHYLDVTSSPPGANDWNCRPGAEHPEPIILLHGLTAPMAADWATLAPLLANNGYCVFAFNYGMETGMPAPVSRIPGLGDMITSATDELAPFVDRVLAATGAQKVDFVGHSEGTVMPRYYIKYLGGGAKVAKSVNLAPLNHGTLAYGGALLGQLLDSVGLWGDTQQILTELGDGAGIGLTTGSDYLKSVNADPAYNPDTRYTFIMTRFDEIVMPYTSGYGPDAANVTNVVVQDRCPLELFEHNGASSDPVALQYVLNALDPDHQAPIDCAGHPRNG